MSNEEKLLPLLTAVEQETGTRPHPSTLHRWRLFGIAGVKLETVRVGGRRMCSVKSVREFLERVTAATDHNSATSMARTSKQRSRAADSANRQLEEAGI